MIDFNVRLCAFLAHITLALSQQWCYPYIYGMPTPQVTFSPMNATLTAGVSSLQINITTATSLAYASVNVFTLSAEGNELQSCADGSPFFTEDPDDSNVWSVVCNIFELAVDGPVYYNIYTSTADYSGYYQGCSVDAIGQIVGGQPLDVTPTKITGVLTTQPVLNISADDGYIYVNVVEKGAGVQNLNAWVSDLKGNQVCSNYPYVNYPVSGNMNAGIFYLECQPFESTSQFPLINGNATLTVSVYDTQWNYDYMVVNDAFQITGGEDLDVEPPQFGNMHISNVYTVNEEMSFTYNISDNVGVSYSYCFVNSVSNYYYSWTSYAELIKGNALQEEYSVTIEPTLPYTGAYDISCYAFDYQYNEAYWSGNITAVAATSRPTTAPTVAPSAAPTFEPTYTPTAAPTLSMTIDNGDMTVTVHFYITVSNCSTTMHVVDVTKRRLHVEYEDKTDAKCLDVLSDGLTKALNLPMGSLKLKDSNVTDVGVNTSTIKMTFLSTYSVDSNSAEDAYNSIVAALSLDSSQLTSATKQIQGYTKANNCPKFSNAVLSPISVSNNHVSSMSEQPAQPDCPSYSSTSSSNKDADIGEGIGIGVAISFGIIGILAVGLYYNVKYYPDGHLAKTLFINSKIVELTAPEVNPMTTTAA